MPMDAQQLIEAFNSMADTPEELIELLTPTAVKGRIQKQRDAFIQKANARLSAMQEQIDAIRNLYDVAVNEASTGATPTAIPDTAAEDASLV